MPLNWFDPKDTSFNALLLLERVQLSWLPGWQFPPGALALALRANPAVAWFLKHKCPEIQPWVEEVETQAAHLSPADPVQVRQAEVAVLRCLEDLLVYALEPSIYDALPFTRWDARELLDLVDFSGKTVIDVGAGPGPQTLRVAPLAKAVFAVEPVGSLRQYLRQKAQAAGLRNVFPVDGLVTQIPFPDGFADVTLAGHVYGDAPPEEMDEMERVTRPGGMVILIPGNNDLDSPEHDYLLQRGYRWARYLEPPDGWVRKYWKEMA